MIKKFVHLNKNIKKSFHNFEILKLEYYLNQRFKFLSFSIFSIFLCSAFLSETNIFLERYGLSNRIKSKNVNILSIFVDDLQSKDFPISSDFLKNQLKNLSYYRFDAHSTIHTIIPSYLEFISGKDALVSGYRSSVPTKFNFIEQENILNQNKFLLKSNKMILSNRSCDKNDFLHLNLFSNDLKTGEKENFRFSFLTSSIISMIGLYKNNSFCELNILKNNSNILNSDVIKELNQFSNDPKNFFISILIYNNKTYQYDRMHNCDILLLKKNRTFDAINENDKNYKQCTYEHISDNISYLLNYFYKKHWLDNTIVILHSINQSNDFSSDENLLQLTTNLNLSPLIILAPKNHEIKTPNNIEISSLLEKLNLENSSFKNKNTSSYYEESDTDNLDENDLEFYKNLFFIPKNKINTLYSAKNRFWIHNDIKISFIGDKYKKKIYINKKISSQTLKDDLQEFQIFLNSYGIHMISVINKNNKNLKNSKEDKNYYFMESNY